jgi:hypothetical protein
MRRQDFHFGYIETEVFRHYEKGIDIVVGSFTVEVDVTLVYENVIKEMRPAVLYDNATQISHDITVTSPDCGPPCDRLRDAVLSYAKDYIDSARNLTIEFVDLSAICRRASCSIQAYGLYFMLNVQ